MATPEIRTPVGAVALRIRGLRKTFGTKQVLKGVDLDLHAGEFVTLLGANGSGKSTALKSIVGLQTADEGLIEVDGAPATADPTKTAMVFQQIHLVKRRSVLDNVCAGALGRLPMWQSLHPWLFPAALRQEAMHCLDRVGLADRASEPAGKLSGGQQQRVAIARALCQRAKVVLADEPVSALDPNASEQVLALLAELATEGLGVLAVLHQPELAMKYSSRLIGLNKGVVEFDLPTPEVDMSMVDALYSGDQK
ncbi:ATP-binding cassette domain-containing protein [Pseudonocardiaceae bacterium YIM PH 21723]|nr:ATP-binding cassette domain-containing protein [Pseudonocardiaceae bacterium YIM PH 21723]